MEKKAECHVTHDFCDVISNGFLFRFVIFTDREEALLRHHLAQQTLQLEAFQESFLQQTFLPSHVALLKNEALQNPAFLPCVRLAKLWVSSQMLSHSIPEYLIEELVVSVFGAAHPLTPTRGFLLFLRLLAQFDWPSSALVINSNGSLTPEAIVDALKSVESQRAVSNQPVCVVTPFDLKSQCTVTKPEAPAWSRLVQLARGALRDIHKHWLEEEEMKGVFTPQLRDFDVVLTLREDVLSPQAAWVKHVGGKAGHRGSAYKCSLAKNVMLDRSRLLIGYEPEKRILEAVEKEVGVGGVVLMNCEFGKKIGISWKPSYFLPLKMSMANVADCCPIAKGSGTKKEDRVLVRTVFDVMHRIREALGDVLVKVDFY